MSKMCIKILSTLGLYEVGGGGYEVVTEHGNHFIKTEECLNKCVGLKVNITSS